MFPVRPLTGAAADPIVPERHVATPESRPDRPPVKLDHARAPYFEALRNYAGRGPGRYHVPGHKGGSGTDPQLRAALGEQALELDVPLVIHGIDVGAETTPLDRALELAADAWGAQR